MRLEAQADLLHPRRARGTIVGGCAHLDELVRFQRAVDLGHHLFGESLVADDDDGIEVMGLGAQFAAAPGAEGSGHSALSRV